MARSYTEAETGHTIYQYGSDFVVHFLAIADADWESDGIELLRRAYVRAQDIAADFGGRRFHNPSFRGGIAFDDIDQLHDCIASVTETKTTKCKG